MKGKGKVGYLTGGTLRPDLEVANYEVGCRKFHSYGLAHQFHGAKDKEDLSVLQNNQRSMGGCSKPLLRHGKYNTML